MEENKQEVTKIDGLAKIAEILPHNTIYRLDHKMKKGRSYVIAKTKARACIRDLRLGFPLST